MERTVILDGGERIEVAHALLYKADKYIDMVTRTRADIEEYGADGHMTDESTYGEFLEWVMGQLRIIRNVLDKIDYIPAPVGRARHELDIIWDNLVDLTHTPLVESARRERRG